ncbi:NADH-quinone oxidoreductase subunit C [Cryobacterium sp. M91]|uniref:hydrogenase large subunit n=1 Tax=Cryobacterium sp. M91 TaxID=2048294 RepID=UPI000CE304ED|nr:NADH-quinone oxidoreductase subunit C [Cryobacterium sp. M91]
MNQLYPDCLTQIANVTSDGSVHQFVIESAETTKTLRQLLESDDLTFKMIDATHDNHREFRLYYIFTDTKRHTFIVAVLPLLDTIEFATIANVLPAAGRYENKLCEMFGLHVTGRGPSQRMLLHENWPENLHPLRKDVKWDSRPEPAGGNYQFQDVSGEGIYEIPVGPIHAGIIEPGHFRFSVAGEEIVLLEPRLGYAHKGSEKLFEQLPFARQIILSEKIAGDTSFSYSLAYCQAVESLAGILVTPEHGQARVLFSELERLANHFGDIGGIMLDAGFNFGGAGGARMRETILRLNDKLSGSRLLRGINTFGGVAIRLSRAQITDLRAELPLVEKDFEQVMSIAENTVTLLNRLKGTGVLTLDVAARFGMMGPVGRASGQDVDVRRDFPYAGYGTLPSTLVPVETSGDVYARFRVRVREVGVSFKIIDEVLSSMSSIVPIPSNKTIKLCRNSLGIGCTEGWRGEILCVVHTNAEGVVSRVAVRDPSFVNWQGVSEAAFGGVVPDFPLVNKSFGLSYSGNDT